MATVENSIKEGANVQETTDDDRTPLSLAAANWNEAVVKLLLERDDVKVDLKHNDGWYRFLWRPLKGTRWY